MERTKTTTVSITKDVKTQKTTELKAAESTGVLPVESDQVVVEEYTSMHEAISDLLTVGEVVPAGEVNEIRQIRAHITELSQSIPLMSGAQVNPENILQVG